MYTSSYQLATDTHRSPNTLAPPHRAAAELKHNNYNHIHVHNLHVSVDFAAHFPGTKKKRYDTNCIPLCSTGTAFASVGERISRKTLRFVSQVILYQRSATS